MNAEMLCDAMSHIDSAYIDAAQRRQAGRRAPHRVRWGTLAACLCLVLGGAIALRGQWNDHTAEQTIDYSSWTVKELPAGSNVLEVENMLVPHWDEMTPIQQFSFLEWEGGSYDGRNAPLPSSLLGDALGTATLSGLDQYTMERHTRDAALYAIEGISPHCALAAELEGHYYSYVNSYYKPATLGQFIDDLALEEQASFGSVWYSFFVSDLPNVVQRAMTEAGMSGYQTVEFTGADSARIWALLLSDRAAENVTEFDCDPAIGKTVMSVSLNMELLGYRNISLAVTDTGYLTTNLLDTGKAFYIGSDKVDAFTDYVLQSCEGHRIIYLYDDLHAAQEDTPTEETAVYWIDSSGNTGMVDGETQAEWTAASTPSPR